MNWIIENAPMIGMLFFISVFIWIAFNTLRPSNKKELESHSFIPLKDKE